MILDRLKNIPIILGSQSPRRKELLASMDIDFEVIVKSIDESVDNDILPKDVAAQIALKKIDAFDSAEYADHLIITADTIVVNEEDGQVLGKPIDAQEVIDTLARLSGKSHWVYTGVGIKYKGNVRSFTCGTKVCFSVLEESEIRYYLDKYAPYDKAGSYGIQEWIGRIGVEHIEGSFENVMGLPTNKLYQVLKDLI